MFSNNEININNGLTLIELLTVLVIIGILAMIAIPNYQNYINRAKFSEIIEATAPFKLGLILCANLTGSLLNCSNGNNETPANLTSPTTLIDSVIITANTEISAVIKATASSLIKNSPTYILTASLDTKSGQVSWQKSGSCVAMRYC